MFFLFLAQRNAFFPPLARCLFLSQMQPSEKKRGEDLCSLQLHECLVKEDAAPAHFISLIFALLAPRCLRFVFMNITFQKRSRFFLSLSLSSSSAPLFRVQTKFASKTLDDIFVFLKSLACDSHACLPLQLIMHALRANFRLIL